MSALKPQDTRALARGAIIAALYTALTVLLAPLSYGEVQIRFSEAFTLLPILMPEAVPALLVGCLLANILGGCTIFDIVFGSLATLLAALCTRRLREKFWLAALMPVLFNGVIVGAVVHFCYSRRLRCRCACSPSPRARPSRVWSWARCSSACCAACPPPC